MIPHSSGEVYCHSRVWTLADHTDGSFAMASVGIYALRLIHPKVVHGDCRIFTRSI
jgi:hypothetical protein